MSTPSSTSSPTSSRSLADGTPCPPTFRDALATQAVCDAVLDSAEQRKWEDVVPV